MRRSQSSNHPKQSDFENYRFLNAKKAGLEQKNNRFKKLSASERLVKFSTLHIFSIIGLIFWYIFNRILIKFIINPVLEIDEKSKLYAHDNQTAILTSTLAVGIFMIKLYHYELKRTTNRTKFMSQNPSPTNDQINNALNSLLNENFEIICQWTKFKKLSSHDEIILYLKNKIKNGMCFGYTISAIDSVRRYPDLTGSELIDKINYITAIKKHILHIIKQDLHDYFHPEPSIILSPHKYETIDRLIRLSYQTNNCNYLNNHYQDINIKVVDINALTEIFFTSLNFEFISINKYSVHISNHMHVDDDTMLSENEKNHINKIKTSDSKQSRFLEVQLYKDSLNLYKRVNEFKQENIAPLPNNIILTGEVLLKSTCLDVSHSIMFRCSNGSYYFIDSNTGSNEYETLLDFLAGLRNHSLEYYGWHVKDLYLKFIFHAVHPQNKPDKFNSLQCSPRATQSLMKKIFTKPKPLVFKEQLENSPAVSQANSNLVISFLDYKIDYDDLLGEGEFGKVYGIIERPQNEKKFIANFMPYLYDYIFRAKPDIKKKTNWCIKISKMFLTVAIHQLWMGNDLFLSQAISSLFERSAQRSAHLLREKYQFTALKIADIQYSLYPLVKTRVTGKTLRYYLKKGYFEDKAQYIFRKAYFNFLWKLYNVPLAFGDLHPENIMYDENTQLLEIVDSSSSETDSPNRSHIYNVDGVSTHTVTGKILNFLDQAAKHNMRYTEELDRTVLDSANLKPVSATQEFNNSREKNEVSYFGARYLANHWKKGEYPKNYFFNEKRCQKLKNNNYFVDVSCIRKVIQ